MTLHKMCFLGVSVITGYLVGQALPTPKTAAVRKYATVSILDGPNACQPAGSFYGPHYGGQLCSVPAIPIPLLKQERRDLNFGMVSVAITGSTFVHGYSMPSPASATNHYMGITDDEGRHFALDMVTGAHMRIPITSSAPLWDSLDDDMLYYPSGSIWFKYSVAKDASNVLIDLTGKLQTISNGGSTHISSDNWTAYWSEPDHTVCALDFNSLKTYCADYMAPETRSSVLGWDFIDYSMVSDVDTGSGQRYVMLMASPSCGIWTVDMKNGVLKFLARGGENPKNQGFYQPNGNGDGRCDPGENCLNAPHGDLATIKGIQYFVTYAEMASVPCERDLVALPIAAGENMVAKRVTIAPLAYCSSAYEWPDIHVGCAAKTGACVISTETVGAAPYGNQIMLMQDLDHLVKLGYHYSQGIGSDNYWFQPRAGISPDGRYLIYDSNSGQADEGTGMSHEQVFLVPLTRR